MTLTLGDAPRGASLHGLERWLPAVVRSLRQGHGVWKLWGILVVPLDSLVELKRLYFRLAVVAVSEENGGSVWCSKKVVRLLFL
jgi:hypothetical protein